MHRLRCEQLLVGVLHGPNVKKWLDVSMNYEVHYEAGPMDVMPIHRADLINPTFDTGHLFCG